MNALRNGKPEVELNPAPAHRVASPAEIAFTRSGGGLGSFASFNFASLRLLLGSIPLASTRSSSRDARIARMTKAVAIATISRPVSVSREFSSNPTITVPAALV